MQVTGWIERRPTLATGILVVLVWVQLALGLRWRLATLAVFAAALVVWLLIVRAAAAGSIDRRTVLLGCVAALVGCVLFPPATSLDVNSYSLYGRMVAEYGANPYVTIPRDVAFDPWYERTSYFWTDSPSVYGPLFTGLSAVVMAIAGESFTVARLLFQILMAGAFFGAAVLVSRRTLAGAAFLALNPLLLTFGVNDAHCDVLVGTAVLAGALLLERRQALTAGFVLGSATLIKFSAAPALAGAVVWLFFSVGWRSAVKASVAGVATLAAGLWVGGGMTSLVALSEAAERQTRFSVWSPVHGALSELSANGGTVLGLSIDRLVGSMASLTVAAVGLAVIWHHRRGAPFVAVAAGLVAYQVLGAYTLSWYAAWSLPVLALALSSRVTRVAMVHGALLAAAYLSGWVTLLLVTGALVYLVVKRRSGDTLRPCPDSSLRTR